MEVTVENFQKWTIKVGYYVKNNPEDTHPAWFIAALFQVSRSSNDERYFWTVKVDRIVKRLSEKSDLKSCITLVWKHRMMCPSIYLYL